MTIYLKKYAIHNHKRLLSSNIIMERHNKNFQLGIALALASNIVWCVAYISTKILLIEFKPLQICLIRFTFALVLLFIAAPPQKKRMELKEELLIAVAGLLGIFLYYLLENGASNNTYVSNVSIIVTTIPLITTILGPFFFKDEHFKIKYVIAFILSMVGVITLLLTQGELEGVSIKGDMLALFASIVFSVYTLVLKTIHLKITTIQLTRKTFFYGWIFTLIFQIFFGEPINYSMVITTPFIWHLLFLGIFPSCLCFIAWAKAVRIIGASRSSQFIYIGPVVTVILSYFILGEKITETRLLAMGIIILGVIISQYRSNNAIRTNNLDS